MAIEILTEEFEQKYLQIKMKDSHRVLYLPDYISYGIFTRQQAATLIPKSNPFLRNLFQYIAGYDLDESIRWIVDSLADMFNYVNTTAIHKEFESKDKDPFLHFYEDFLTRYDKNLKNAKGAYYSLESPERNVQKLGLYKWLSDEVTEAQKIKK